MLPPKMTSAVLAVAALILCMGSIHAQENAQLQIPASLVECYNTSLYMNRDNRLPSTIETLITLIEKVENTPNLNQDIRTIAISLLHRFRQDGIQMAPGITAQPGVIPYSPTGFQFPKFRILLSRLIPGDARQFPNSSLTQEERCSMHFMLSSSFNTQVRGDENQVCGQIAQYRAQRLPRSAVPMKNNFVGDVELLDILNAKSGNRGIPQSASKQYVRTPTNAQQYGNSYWPDIDNNNGNGNSYDNGVSQCPVENGVIWTPWGTVAAGTLIAGIAAGLQPQQVPLRTLLALSRRSGSGTNAPQTATVPVDNRWAATLAGDLAEVALIQVPATQQETASVGSNGAWNSTVMPKWFFLSQRQNLEMTDAEIRGGLDGLILGMNIATWRNQASSLKLSQLLRMYYSMGGVLSSGIMACNRKDNFQTVAPLTDMIAQTSAFAQVLDREMQLRVTLSPVAIAQFAATAAGALQQYVPGSLNDLSCSVSNSQPTEISESVTAMTNIYVFLDTTWQYNDIVSYVNYILQRLNINPYASSVTMIAAFDGTVMVNTTNYLDDVYQNWNVTTHSTFNPGFNLPTILRTVQNMTQAYMNVQQANSSVGGLSMIALLIPYQQSISDADSSYSVTRLQYINEQVPDLRFIYYAGGTITRFSSFVQNPQDLFPLNLGTPVVTASGPVVMRIKKIQRRIINPRCGASWYTSSWGTDQMYQYARPGVINFYRMVPNYFFGAGTARVINIQAQYAQGFTICTSRTNPLPMQNASTSSSTSDLSCTTYSGSTFTYDLSTACNGYYTIHQCPALYMSVQMPAVASTGSSSSLTVSCQDNACQTPDQIRYTVSVVNMGCYSGVSGLIASFGLVALAAMLRQLLQ